MVPNTLPMRRSETPLLERDPRGLELERDVIVIGGGVNGVGVLRDATLRGFSVSLFERNDLAFGASGLAHAQDASADDMAKHRALLADDNPAELWEMRGEALWKKPAGPNQVSLERCDLGQGPGIVKGAYVELPRYFKDSNRVM